MLPSIFYPKAIHPRRWYALLFLFLACFWCILPTTPEATAKGKHPAAYIRVWVALVDKNSQYSLSTVMPDQTPQYLFGPSKAGYQFDNYSEIPPGQYEFSFNRITAGGAATLGREKVTLSEGDFITLLVRPDSHGNPTLALINDTMPPAAPMPPIARVYNLVSETPLTITSGDATTATVVQPFEGPVFIKNIDTVASRAAFHSKDGENIEVDLPFDLKRSPLHTILLVKDGYGDIYPRITTDGVIVK